MLVIGQAGPGQVITEVSVIPESGSALGSQDWLICHVTYLQTKRLEEDQTGALGPFCL